MAKRDHRNCQVQTSEAWLRGSARSFPTLSPPRQQRSIQPAVAYPLHVIRELAWGVLFCFDQSVPTVSPKCIPRHLYIHLSGDFFHVLAWLYHCECTHHPLLTVLLKPNRWAVLLVPFPGSHSSSIRSQREPPHPVGPNLSWVRESTFSKQPSLTTGLPYTLKGLTCTILTWVAPSADALTW